MAAHSDHPDIRDEGLADDCERCTEMAAQPLTTLDRDNLRDLVQRTLSNRFGDSMGRLQPRSQNEAVAMGHVMTTLERTGQLFTTAPDEIIYYLRMRWKISLAVNRGWNP